MTEGKRKQPETKALSHYIDLTEDREREDDKITKQPQRERGMRREEKTQ